MKVWTDKEGRKLTAGEFFSRWKGGIERVTPLQQIKINLFGYFIIFIGILWGLIITFKIKQWWLFTILIGSCFVTGMQFLSVIQKFIILDRIEKEVAFTNVVVEESPIKNN